jgi:hypothetical protein
MTQTGQLIYHCFDDELRQSSRYNTAEAIKYGISNTTKGKEGESTSFTPIKLKSGWCQSNVPYNLNHSVSDIDILSLFDRCLNVIEVKNWKEDTIMTPRLFHTHVLDRFDTSDPTVKTHHEILRKWYPWLGLRRILIITHLNAENPEIYRLLYAYARASGIRGRRKKSERF